jgi:hypothetical protein
MLEQIKLLNQLHNFNAEAGNIQGVLSSKFGTVTMTVLFHEYKNVTAGS